MHRPLRRLRPMAAVAAAIGLGGLFLVGVPTTAAQRHPAAHPRSAGSTFVVANTSSVQKLDPDVVTNFLDFQSLGLIYDTLVQLSRQLQIVPNLATSWQFGPGNRSITFQLRQGVAFDDGSAFTSADVVASLNRVVNPKTGDAAASYLAAMKQVVAEGPYTVKLILSRPDVSLLYGLTSMNLAMLPAKAIASGSIATRPDGTGPFQFVSWSPGNSFVVKRNPHYWGGRVSLARIEIKTIASEQSIASALQANTVQLGLLTQPQVADHLPSSFHVDRVLDLSYRALMLQDHHGPLANVNNRRAIACAVNRSQVLGDSVFGQGRVVGPVPLGPYASKPVSAICATPDLAQARRYLSAAGDPSGFSFTAITSTDLDPTSSAQAIAVQLELARVGIKMSIQNLAGDAYIQDWLKGDFQAAFAENGADPDPYTMYGRYFGPGANLGVPAGYSSTALQRLLVQGDEAAAAVTRSRIWSQLSSTLTGNAVWIWLFDSFDYAVLAPGVHGFSLSPSTSTSLRALSSTTVS